MGGILLCDYRIIMTFIPTAHFHGDQAILSWSKYIHRVVMPYVLKGKRREEKKDSIEKMKINKNKNKEGKK